MVLPKAMRSARDPEPEAEVDLAARGAVELAAEGGHGRDHLGRRVGLDRVVDAWRRRGRPSSARYLARSTSRSKTTVGRSKSRARMKASCRAVTALSGRVNVEESSGLARKGGSVSHAHLHQSRGILNPGVPKRDVTVAA